MPKPVIAAVNGPAVGIGCSLALCCDLIVAAESAYFLLAFVNIGLVPDGGSSLFVPTRIGMARAAELAMLGERLPAPTALEWGLINRVVPDDSLASEAAALASRLASGPTRSYAGTKRQLNNWLYSRMDEQLELEAQIQREMSSSDDFVEGAMAFVQKREARFSGPLDSKWQTSSSAYGPRLNRIRAAVGHLLPSTLAFFTPESGGSPNANEIASLYKITLVIAIIIFVVVEGALIYALIKFRKKKGAVPAQIRGNTRLEAGWTIAAALILVALAIVTFIKLSAIQNPPNSNAAGANCPRWTNRSTRAPRASCRRTAKRSTSR